MKAKRQQKIFDLISQRTIETQEELVKQLREEGFQVTQATISRDIREMRLIKVGTNDGGQKYSMARPGSHEEQENDKYLRIFKEGLLTVQPIGQLLVIRTVVGAAMAVAAAIDSLAFDNIVGTIAGDDTIFCAVLTEEDAFRIQKQMQAYLSN